MTAFFIIEIHVDFQLLIDGFLTAKGALQAWPWTRDGCFQRQQGLGRTFSYGYARARAPSCEKEISEKSRTVNWQCAVKVLFSRKAIPYSLSCKSAHTSIHWDKKTGDLKLPTCKMGKWHHNLYLAVMCHGVRMLDKNIGVFFSGNNSSVPQPPMTFVSGKKSPTLCQLIKSRKEMNLSEVINSVCIFVFSVLSISCDELVTLLPSSAQSTRAGLPRVCAKTISLGKGGVSRHAVAAQGVMGYIIQQNDIGDPVEVFRCISAWEHLWKILGISWDLVHFKGENCCRSIFMSFRIKFFLAGVI